MADTQQMPIRLIVLAAAAGLGAWLLWKPSPSGVSFKQLPPSSARHHGPAAVAAPNIERLRLAASPSGAVRGPRPVADGATDPADHTELETRIEAGGRDAAIATSELARLVEAQGDRARARELFEDAVRRWDAETGDESTPGATARLELAEFEIREGKLEAALKRVDEALSSAAADDAWPDRVRALYVKASVLRRLGRASEALAQVERALSVSSSANARPDHVELHGALLVETGKLDEAVALFDKAQQGPSEPGGMPARVRFAVGKAEALVDLGRYEEALEPLEEALKSVSAADTADVGDLRPRIQFALAQVLRETGGDEARVKTLANAARDAWKGRTDQLSLDRLGRLEAFLGM